MYAKMSCNSVFRTIICFSIIRSLYWGNASSIKYRPEFTADSMLLLSTSTPFYKSRVTMNSRLSSVATTNAQPTAAGVAKIVFYYCKGKNISPNSLLTPSWRIHLLSISASPKRIYREISMMMLHQTYC